MKSCGHIEHNNNCWECTSDSLRVDNSALRGLVGGLLAIMRRDSHLEFTNRLLVARAEALLGKTNGFDARFTDDFMKSGDGVDE